MPLDLAAPSGPNVTARLTSIVIRQTSITDRGMLSATASCDPRDRVVDRGVRNHQAASGQAFLSYSGPIGSAGSAAMDWLREGTCTQSSINWTLT